MTGRENSHKERGKIKQSYKRAKEES